MATYVKLPDDAGDNKGTRCISVYCYKCGEVLDIVSAETDDANDIDVYILPHDCPAKDLPYSIFR